MSGITDPTEAYFKDGGWGWDGTQWRKLPMVWGYSGQYAEYLGKTMTADEAFDETGAIVPAGEVWVLQHLFIQNWTGARGAIPLGVVLNAGVHRLYYIVTPAARELVQWTGEIIMAEGDYVTLYQYTCLNNDVVRAGASGYKMKIAE